MRSTGPVRIQPRKELRLDDVLMRSTFIVDDIEAAVTFYTGVFGWRVVYDTVLAVDYRFPPAAPDGAPCRLVIMQAEHPEIGGIGFMRYLNDPIAPGPSKHRDKLRGFVLNHYAAIAISGCEGYISANHSPCRCQQFARFKVHASGG